MSPGGELQPYSSAIAIKLKDANGDDISQDGTYSIHPVGLKKCSGFVATDGKAFPNGDVDPVPVAVDYPAYTLTGDACEDYVSGTYTGLNPLFEVIYSSEGKTNTWTVNYEGQLTLGATTIQLKHAHALLRLPMTATSVTSGTYIVNGTVYNVTSLGTLWAVNTSSTTYIPLTAVTIDGTDYLQAIVPADSEGIYTLTGFKAVMNVSGGGTLTLDLPFKEGTAEEELSNLLNEPITVDGIQYIKLGCIQ